MPHRRAPKAAAPRLKAPRGSSRRRSPTPSACAPTACPTSPTRTPAGASSSTRSPGLISSPAFKAAQAKCHKLLPGGPGSGPPPSAQKLAQFLKVSQCMRQNGISDFPDPRTSVPPNPFGSGAGVISDIEGVILVFPSTIDQQSPAVHAGGSRVRVPAAQPLMDAKLNAGNPIGISLHTKRLTPPRARLLTAAALLSGVLVTGCGGSSPSTTGGASTSASAASAVESGVAFSRCIRSHGVPNFPDPKVSGQTDPDGLAEHLAVAGVPVRRALVPAPAAEGASGLRTPVPAGAGADARGVRMYAQARDLGVPRSEHLASIELGRQQRDHRQRGVLPRDPEARSTRARRRSSGRRPRASCGDPAGSRAGGLTASWRRAVILSYDSR